MDLGSAQKFRAIDKMPLEVCKVRCNHVLIDGSKVKARKVVLF